MMKGFRKVQLLYICLEYFYLSYDLETTLNTGGRGKYYFDTYEYSYTMSYINKLRELKEFNIQDRQNILINKKNNI